MDQYRPAVRNRKTIRQRDDGDAARHQRVCKVRDHAVGPRSMLDHLRAQYEAERVALVELLCVLRAKGDTCPRTLTFEVCSCSCDEIGLDVDPQNFTKAKVAQ